MKLSTTPIQAFYLYVLVALLFLLLVGTAHRMTQDDEERALRFHCEMIAERAWPADPSIDCGDFQ